MALSVPAQAGDRSEPIGRSVQGRRIEASVIGDRGAPRVALVFGCIHGDECAGKRVIGALWRMAPLDGVQVWVVRDLNPDGSRAGTRQNARGVDLNRNFPHDWEPGTPGDRYYPGPEPLSEPETRAARRLILDVRPDVTVWYHQPLGYVIRSSGDVAIMRRYARLTGLPLREYRSLNGTAVGWQNNRFPNKTAFVVELGAGELSRRAARRHARAVIEITR